MHLEQKSLYLFIHLFCVVYVYEFWSHMIGGCITVVSLVPWYLCIESQKTQRFVDELVLTLTVSKITLFVSQGRGW